MKGYSVPGVVTGKPISLGGSEGRGEATGAAAPTRSARPLEGRGRPRQERDGRGPGFRERGQRLREPALRRAGREDRRSLRLEGRDLQGRRVQPPCSRRAQGEDRLGRRVPGREVDLERRAPRAQGRHPRPRGAREPAQTKNADKVQAQDHRRGGERPDPSRGGHDPLPEEDRRAAGYPRERGRRHRELLRVGPGHPGVLLAPRRGQPAPRAGDGPARTTTSTRSRWSARSTTGPPPTSSRSSGSSTRSGSGASTRKREKGGRVRPPDGRPPALPPGDLGRRRRMGRPLGRAGPLGERGPRDDRRAHPGGLGPGRFSATGSGYVASSRSEPSTGE